MRSFVHLGIIVRLFLCHLPYHFSEILHYSEFLLLSGLIAPLFLGIIPPNYSELFLLALKWRTILQNFHTYQPFFSDFNNFLGDFSISE